MAEVFGDPVWEGPGVHVSVRPDYFTDQRVDIMVTQGDNIGYCSQTEFSRV